jgi:hypothetical protein
MSKRWSKRLESLDVPYRALLDQTVPLLKEALDKWDGTQEEFAKSLGESRTNISHIVNCLNPRTKNPEFKPLHTVRRIHLKLVALGDTVSPVEARTESSNASFNRILGGLRNFIKDEVRVAVKEEIEKAKREAAARKAHIKMDWAKNQPQSQPQELPIPITEVGTVWIPKDKRRKGPVTVVTTNLREDRVIVRTSTGRMAQRSLQKFIKRYRKV